MPPKPLQKRPRAPSSDSSNSDFISHQACKRKRVPNDRRRSQKGVRAAELFSKNLDNTTLERRATPPRPSISPNTPDKLTTLLNRIDTLIATDDTLSAYKTLQIIMRDEDMQANASRESLLRVVKFMQLLGDGKRQCTEQARIINAARQREMEMESEVKRLVGENLQLRMLKRQANGI